MVLIPGYGPAFGVTMADLSAGIEKHACGAGIDVPTFGADISILSEEGRVVLR